MILPLAVKADSLGFKIGANVLQLSFSGYAQHGDYIDIENDLGFKEDDAFQGYFSLEHPIPLIPNILIQRTIIDTNASGDLTGKSFDDTTFSGTVNSTIELTHTDATLYYEVLDNWVSLDIGVSARVFSQGLEINDGSQQVSLDIDQVVPMLYSAVKFELPLTGLYVGADGNGVAFNDEQLIDVKANIGWESPLGLGLEAGYRYFDLKYKDDEEQAKMQMDGPYAGLFFHF
jgi:outer membrane protein